MKTSQGKLTLFAFLILISILLLLPMRVGREDSLVLNPSGLRMSPGGSYKLTCLLSSENLNQTIHYQSENEKIATIEGDGTVNALSAGNTVITVTASDGATAHCDVEVTGVPLSELELNVSQLSIRKGQYSGLSVSYNTDASDTRLQWSSADASIATVDNTGRVKGISGGHTTVTVTAPNGKSAACDVTVVVDSTAVSITPDDMIVGVGAQVPLKATFMPADSTDTVESWVVSNPNVITVDDNGVMTALAEGTVHISALTQCGLTAGIEVMVEAAPKDMELNPNRATIVRGDTLDMQLLLMDSAGSMNRSDHPVVWTSSDTNVAVIDENGRVTAMGSGVTRITASSDGRTVSGYITVRVYVREIMLEETEVWLLKEQTGTPIQLKLRTEPTDADNPEITFVSNNTQVANVSEEGLVTMTGGYGTAVITASAEGGATAQFTVNVVTELPEPETEETTEELPEETEAAQPGEDPAAETVETESAAETEDIGSDWDIEEDESETDSESSGEYALDEYGEIIYDEYGEPVYA